jgi:Fur family transcriptional regulator, peroxide stress response regulator
MGAEVQEDVQARMAEFARRCKESGLAGTHQRMVIYRVLATSADHPSPELVYERVRLEIPSISKATVYKNIHAFIEAGMLREVSELHQTNRLDANLERHHHLICTRCKKVVDYQDEQLNEIRSSESEPLGFRLYEYRVEARGLCPACRLESAKENQGE